MDWRLRRRGWDSPPGKPRLNPQDPAPPTDLPSTRQRLRAAGLSVGFGYRARSRTVWTSGPIWWLLSAPIQRRSRTEWPGSARRRAAPLEVMPLCEAADRDKGAATISFCERPLQSEWESIWWRGSASRGGGHGAGACSAAGRTGFCSSQAQLLGGTGKLDQPLLGRLGGAHCVSAWGGRAGRLQAIETPLRAAERLSALA